MKSMHLHRVYLATEQFLLSSGGTEVGGKASMEKIMGATLEAYMAHTPQAIRELANEVGPDRLSSENYAIFRQGCTDLGSMDDHAKRQFARVLINNFRTRIFPEYLSVDTRVASEHILDNKTREHILMTRIFPKLAANN